MKNKGASGGSEKKGQPYVLLCLTIIIFCNFCFSRCNLTGFLIFIGKVGSAVEGGGLAKET